MNKFFLFPFFLIATIPFANNAQTQSIVDFLEFESNQFAEISSLIESRSPLDDCDEAQERSGSPFGKKRAILIGIDGCRIDSLRAADTPNLDHLANNGAASYFTQCSYGQPTYSGPNWATILTGVWADKHFVLDNNFFFSNLDEYPTVFERIREAKPDAFLSSIVNWEPINTRLVTRANSEISAVSDEWVTQLAVCSILRDGPDFSFIQFDELDAAGHRGGYHPENQDYLSTLSRIDGYIGEIMEVIQQRIDKFDENWLIIISSDHGGTASGNHGGLTAEEVFVPLFFYGQDALNRPISRPVPFNTDIVPTLLGFLELETDPAWNLDGRTLPGVKIEIGIELSPTSSEIILKWPGVMRLESSVPSTGSWSDLGPVKSPFTISPENTSKHYRLSY